MIRPNNHTSILRFGLIGIWNTVFDFALFSLFVLVLHWHEITANTVSFCVVVTLSYGLNRWWSFAYSQKTKHWIRSYLEFVSASLLSLGATTLILIFGAPWADVLVLKACAIIIGPALNYLMYRYIVFTPNVVENNESDQLASTPDTRDDSPIR